MAWNFKRDETSARWSRWIGWFLAVIGSVKFFQDGPPWAIWALLMFWGNYLVSTGSFDFNFYREAFLQEETRKALLAKTTESVSD